MRSTQYKPDNPLDKMSAPDKESIGRLNDARDRLNKAEAKVLRLLNSHDPEKRAMAYLYKQELADAREACSLAEATAPAIPAPKLSGIKMYELPGWLDMSKPEAERVAAWSAHMKTPAGQKLAKEMSVIGKINQMAGVTHISDAEMVEMGALKLRAEDFEMHNPGQLYQQMLRDIEQCQEEEPEQEAKRELRAR